MIAEETKLHVVEFRKERDNFPQIMAKPSQVKTTKSINDMDLNLVSFISFLSFRFSKS